MSLLPRLSLIVKQDFSLEFERVLCGTAAQAMCRKWQVAMQPLAIEGTGTDSEFSGTWA